MREPPPIGYGGAKLATHLVFFAAGFAMAAWAPLVAYAKARIGLDNGGLGLLLLCFGLGSIVTLPLAGGLAHRFGWRLPILAGGLGLCVLLPVLATVASPPLAALALLLFGASLSTLDVAMNLHAVEVEQVTGGTHMSGFHGLFSVGGLLGAGAATALLSLGASPLQTTFAASAVTLAALVVAAPRLLPDRPTQGGAMFAAPRGAVILLGVMAFACFLVEGAMLDWGAVFLVEVRRVDPRSAGIGYAVFSAAMVLGRLTGDRIVAALGGTQVLLWGGLLAAAGVACLLAAPAAPLALAGFGLIGLGAANIVPVLFSAAGRQRAMPPSLAIASMSTFGYAGILAGPAIIGGVAHLVGLPLAIAMLGGLILLAPLGRRAVADSRP